MILPEGEYQYRLGTDPAGTERYALGIERRDPFVVADDQEPNDSVLQARSFPASGTVEGSGAPEVDFDFYRLEPSPDGLPLTITTSGTQSVGLSDGLTDLPLAFGDDISTLGSGPLPVGVPLFLRVSATGAYRVTVQGAGGGGSGAVPESAPSPDLAVHLDEENVAAYWPAGQRVGGGLTISNPGARPLKLSLRTATSDERWRLVLEEAQLTLAASASTEVPFAVLLPANVAADVPVRLSVEARSESGEQGTAAVELTPLRDASPAGAHLTWTVPDALLGGLDLASPALGAVVLPSVDPRERLPCTMASHLPTEASRGPSPACRSN